MIKSFRGRLADGDVQRIKLSTNDGLTGYVFRKLEVIDKTPGQADVECVTKVFTVPQTTADAEVDLTNPTLLAVNFYTFERGNISASNIIIMDSTKFNQDIYITYKDSAGNNNDGNFYIELEQINLNLNEATVATLKDMRGRE
jgi:hypothetical protein